MSKIIESFDVYDSEEEELNLKLPSKLIPDTELGSMDTNIDNKSEKTEELLEKQNNSFSFILSQKNSRNIFKTFDEDSGTNLNINDTILKGNPANLIFQNINFYMGGTQNIWGKSEHIAMKQRNIKGAQYKLYKAKVLNKFKEQKYDDKMIECFTFDTGFELGLERIAQGRARRAYQGKGPIVLNFKKGGGKEVQEGLTKVYLNVDGEFYHLLKTKCITGVIQS